MMPFAKYKDFIKEISRFKVSSKEFKLLKSKIYMLINTVL